MKAIITVLVLVGSSAWGMTNLPEGTYQGNGRWSNRAGQKGNYEITSSIKAGVVSSTYNFDGQTVTYEFQVKPGVNGEFEVFVGGKTAGRGYCKSVQCHYIVGINTTQIEETLTFVNDQFYRLGSKHPVMLGLLSGGTSDLTTWEESMKRLGN